MTKLLLLDGDDQIYQALHRVLYRQDGEALVQRVGTPEECVDRLLDHDYRAVLINVAYLQTPRSISLVREVRAEFPQVTSLVFGVSFSKQTLLELIEAGASAYSRGSASAEEILETLSKVREGHFTMCPDIAAAVMRRIAQLAGYRIPTVAATNGDETTLTRRQKEILQLIRRGFSNAEIASDLCIEVGTVKNHVHNVLQKLEAADRHEAANKAYLVAEDGPPVGS